LIPGLLDLPAPLLEWTDERLSAVLPAPFIIALWAAIAGIVCLELYRLVSPQARIEDLKAEARAAQNRLSGYDGAFEGAWPLIRNLLGVSLKRVGIVLPATLVGAYPVLAVLVWMSTSYGHYFPADDAAVPVETDAPLDARLVRADGQEPRVEARAPDGEVLLEQPLPAPVTVLHKREWWNWLVGNPAGYLPPDAPVESIRIGLPRLEVIHRGPAWLRGWEAVFVPVLFVAALAYKSARRIH
jgi:hypothetical protein